MLEMDESGMIRSAHFRDGRSNEIGSARIRIRRNGWFHACSFREFFNMFAVWQ